MNRRFKEAPALGGCEFTERDGRWSASHLSRVCSKGSVSLAQAIGPGPV